MTMSYKAGDKYTVRTRGPMRRGGPREVEMVREYDDGYDDGWVHGGVRVPINTECDECRTQDYPCHRHQRNSIEVDELWHRIGADGMPPGAKNVVMGGKLIGRVIDMTNYVDSLEPSLDGPKEYDVEIFLGNNEWEPKWGNQYGSFATFDDALKEIVNVAAAARTEVYLK